MFLRIVGDNPDAGQLKKPLVDLLMRHGAHPPHPLLVNGGVFHKEARIRAQEGLDDGRQMRIGLLDTIETAALYTEHEPRREGDVGLVRHIPRPLQNGQSTRSLRNLAVRLHTKLVKIELLDMTVATADTNLTEIANAIVYADDEIDRRETCRDIAAQLGGIGIGP